nr:hypothetical protein [Oceanotoga sp.]
MNRINVELRSKEIHSSIDNSFSLDSSVKTNETGIEELNRNTEEL